MATIKKAQSGYSATAKKVDSLRAVGAKQLGTPAASATLKRLKAAEAKEKKEDAMKAPKKKMKMGGAVKKAQTGYKSKWGEKTADSTKYYNDKAMDNMRAVTNLRSNGASAKDTEGYMRENRQALKDRNRQRMKGTPGYDKNGFPVPKNKMGGKTTKSKMMSKMSKKK